MYLILLLISLLMFLIYFLGVIFLRLLVCKTFLVMMMCLLHVDLKNSVTPKTTLSWITAVRLPVTRRWRRGVVTWCRLSGLHAIFEDRWH